MRKVSAESNLFEFCRAKQKSLKVNFSCMGLHYDFPDKQRLTKQSRQRFMKKFGKYDKMLKNGLWSQEEYAGHIIPLIAFTNHANTKQLRMKHIEKTETANRPHSRHCEGFRGGNGRRHPVAICLI